MSEIYFNQNLRNILLLVKKDLSFDKSLKGDFGLNNNLIDQTCKDFIYTGCQIMNKSILKNKEINNFSINKVWTDLLKNKKLHGFESKLKFHHATNFEIFKKLQDL